MRRKELSFIHRPDFATSAEPATANYAVVKSDDDIRLLLTLPDPSIYNLTWFFVNEKYKGFNVAESKVRSAEQMALAGVYTYAIGRVCNRSSKLLEPTCRTLSCLNRSIRDHFVMTNR